MSERPNVPPADALAEIRAQIKTLEEREKSLRDLIIADKAARTGNRYLAEVRVVETNRVDVKEMRAMHPTIVAEYTFPARSTKVELFEINDETGELTRARRRKEESTTP